MKRTVFILFLILLFTACGSPSDGGDGEVDSASTELKGAEAPTTAPVEQIAEEDITEEVVENVAEEVAEEELETAVEEELEPEQEVVQIEPISPELASEIRENDWTN